MNGKALIVDDEEAVRFFAASGLTQEGWHVNEVSSGEAALTLLEKMPFDIVFLDLRMSGIDGLTVMRQVRKRWPEIKIIIITAHASVDSAIEAVRYGAFDYLRKPCSINDIVTSANRALVEKEKFEQRQLEQAEQKLSTGNSASLAHPAVIETGDLKLDLNSRAVWLSAERVALTPTEYELLELLARSLGQTVAVDQLVQKGLAYEANDISARETLRVHISRLRRKLDGNYILTIRGEGYALAAFPSV